MSADELSRPSLLTALHALQRIADAHGGNRAAGAPGGRASIEYVVGRLRAAGWRVRREPVSFPYFDERRPSRLVSADGALKRTRDFTTLAYSGSGRIEQGLLQVVGNGCDRGDFGSRSTLSEGQRPAQIALAHRGACFFRVKARAAQRAGFAALLVVDRGGGRRAPSGTLGVPGIRIPVLLVSGAAGRELGDGDEVDMMVDAVSERRQSANVIAETAAGGRGDRVVMAGAHLDSVPAGPGINDNGSGVAALLALADALGGRAPGAPVRLGFWTAEELGLIGSRRYVAGLDRAERRHVAAYLNLDMVGSPNASLRVYHDGDPRIERLLRRLVGPRARRTSPGGATDSGPFRRAGIPVGGLFSGASRREDPCYHRACDDLENVDPVALEQLSRAAARGLRRLSLKADHGGPLRRRVRSDRQDLVLLGMRCSRSCAEPPAGPALLIALASAGRRRRQRRRARARRRQGAAPRSCAGRAEGRPQSRCSASPPSTAARGRPAPAASAPRSPTSRRRPAQAGWRVRCAAVQFSYFHERTAPALRLWAVAASQAGSDFTTLTYSGSGSRRRARCARPAAAARPAS